MSDVNDWNKKVIKEFRENDGKVGRPFENTPLLLLHTTGAKTGKERVNPVAYIEDKDRLIVVASKAGAPDNPDWYYNLVDNPEVEVEVGTEQFKAEATVTAEPERTRLYEKMVDKNPGFAEYREKTDRTIPVIALSRLD
jgi:deazaflavin-dependent oxidoreductase (nitroreductase family)